MRKCCTDSIHCFGQRSTERVILRFGKNVRSRCNEVECDPARRACLVTSVQEHAGLGDLEPFFDGLQL